MKKLIVPVLALALTAVPLFVKAQTTGNTGVNITQSFELKEVLNKRGKITLGTDVASTLEFDTEVVEWVVGRDDLLLEPLKSKANPGMLYLRAKATQGASSLDVMLQSGELARFTFSINSKLTEGTRYVVRSAKPAASPGDAARPEEAGGVARGAANLPDWLRLEWRASVTASKDVYLNYILSNQGANAVIADAGKLGVYVTRNGKAVPLKYTLARTTSGGNNFLMRGAQTGTVSIKAADIADASAVLVQWTLIDTKEKVSYLVEQKMSLNEPPPVYLRIPAGSPMRTASPTASSQTETRPAAAPQAWFTDLERFVVAVKSLLHI